MNREDNDGRLNQETEASGDLDSIEIGESNIENDQVWAQFWNKLEDVFSVACFINDIPPRCQSSTENLTERLLVIHE